MEIDTASYVDTMVKIPSKVGYVLITSLGYFLGLSAKVYDVCVENFPHDTIRIYGEKAGKILDDLAEAMTTKNVNNPSRLSQGSSRAFGRLSFAPRHVI